MANELLDFGVDADGRQLFGLALNLDEHTIGAVILGDASGVEEGDEVKPTGEVLSVPVGDAYLGRVVDPLGRPIDGKGPLDESKLDGPAASRSRRLGVVERQPVGEPLQTGIKAIDAMTPIGRGQRQLIIGDRQTGKTAVASTRSSTSARTGRRATQEAGQVHLRRGRPEGLDGRRGRQPPRAARRDGVHDRRLGAGVLARPVPVHRPLRGRGHRQLLDVQGPARLASTTTCPSRPTPTASCRCCCAARRVARPTPVTSSTCTPACSSAPRSCPTSSAAAR
jgi:hypothetical protein